MYAAFEELAASGHSWILWDPADGWSCSNLYSREVCFEADPDVGAVDFSWHAAGNIMVLRGMDPRVTTNRNFLQFSVTPM